MPSGTCVSLLSLTPFLLLSARQTAYVQHAALPCFLEQACMGMRATTPRYVCETERVLDSVCVQAFCGWHRHACAWLPVRSPTIHRNASDNTLATAATELQQRCNKHACQCERQHPCLTHRLRAQDHVNSCLLTLPIHARAFSLSSSLPPSLSPSLSPSLPLSLPPSLPLYYSHSHSLSLSISLSPSLPPSLPLPTYVALSCQSTQATSVYEALSLHSVVNPHKHANARARTHTHTTHTHTLFLILSFSHIYTRFFSHTHT